MKWIRALYGIGMPRNHSVDCTKKTCQVSQLVKYVSIPDMFSARTFKPTLCPTHGMAPPNDTPYRSSHRPDPMSRLKK